MVHFEHDGKPVSLLLDLVEVAMSHSSVNLASVFAKILDDFGIADKVSFLNYLYTKMRLTEVSDSQYYMQ